MLQPPYEPWDDRSKSAAAQLNVFKIIAKDFERPWGGFLVINEDQSQEFANQFFEGIDIKNLNILSFYLKGSNAICFSCVVEVSFKEPYFLTVCNDKNKDKSCP